MDNYTKKVAVLGFGTSPDEGDGSGFSEVLSTHFSDICFVPFSDPKDLNGHELDGVILDTTAFGGSRGRSGHLSLTHKTIRTYQPDIALIMHVGVDVSKLGITDSFSRVIGPFKNTLSPAEKDNQIIDALEKVSLEPNT